MTICANCGSENQSHYRFCLSCGAQLPATPHQPPLGPGLVPAPGAVDLRFQRATPPGMPPSNRSTSVEASLAAQVAAHTVAPCPQCAYTNEPDNRFCASCGFKLTAGTMQGHKSPHGGPSLPPNTRMSALQLTSLNPDGTTAGAYPLPASTTVIGRATGGLFARDNYLSPRHASFTPRGDRLHVKDEGSLNGVFRRLIAEEPWLLEAGQVFRIGQELIRFEALTPKPPDPNGVLYLGAPADGYVGRIVMVLGRQTTGTAFPMPETGLHLGRERGEVLFADDGYVSGLHCRLSFERGKVFLTDMGSSNGTFVRIRDEAEFASGEILLMGQQLFQVAAAGS
jgi:pSer/pThr/pTyr-binding forkhead associated (FHA) protein